MRLTWINIVVVASFIILSSWAIYNTACSLADGLVTADNQKQNQFESTLLNYLWIFSISTIVIGSLIHFYLTKKLTQPLYRLIESTKQMKLGHYPSPINVKTQDEIGQLTAHFNDLVQQLKDNQHHRQKLVSDLSHEIRTPLSNLNGYLNALNNGVIEPDPELFASLHAESKRLISLVDQMDQLKEWDYVSKQTFSEKTPIDMHVLIKQTVDMFHWSLNQADITIEVRAASGTVCVGDDEITQVLSNLMDNAIRYYMRTDPIIIRGEILESEYQLSITGPGQTIPIAEQESIFKRFYRIEHSRARDAGGSGLGLAISKEIIDHHHGKIGVHSEGQLHTFWFTLPLGS